MMKFMRAKTIGFCFLFGAIFCGFSQTNLKETYEEYDQKTGLTNLAVYNGTVHINKDVTTKGEHRYLLNEFNETTVSYNGESFFNIQTKYDLLNDVLVIQPANSSSNIGINSITSKIDFFIISKTDQIFVNLQKQDIKNATAGYYESLLADEISLYKKIWKVTYKRILEGKSYDIFREKSDYFLTYKNTLYSISSKRSLIDIFPNEKVLIEEYFKKQRALEKENYPKFLKNLITQLISKSSTYTN